MTWELIKQIVDKVEESKGFQGEGRVAFLGEPHAYEKADGSLGILINVAVLYRNRIKEVTYWDMPIDRFKELVCHRDKLGSLDGIEFQVHAEESDYYDCITPVGDLHGVSILQLQSMQQLDLREVAKGIVEKSNLESIVRGLTEEN